MSEEDKKEFTVRDKRKLFTEEDTERKEEEKTAGTSEKNGKKELPVDFSSLILSLSTSALIHLGNIPDPLTNKREERLPVVGQTIDLIEILKDKTKGNLTNEEERLIEDLLFDLRMRYIEEMKKG